MFYLCCVVCRSVSVEPALFYQPGKAGYYSPRSTHAKSSLRLNAYRNVGRMIGLCLLHTEVMPLTLCRHVFKFLAGRQVRGQVRCRAVQCHTQHTWCGGGGELNVVSKSYYFTDSISKLVPC